LAGDPHLATRFFTQFWNCSAIFPRRRLVTAYRDGRRVKESQDAFLLPKRLNGSAQEASDQNTDTQIGCYLVVLVGFLHH
jgi:hypothetical protein